MSLKSLVKTRWSVEAGRISIFPYGLTYILAGVLGILFLGIYLVYANYLTADLSSEMLFPAIMVIIILIFASWGATAIEFDLSRGIMRRRLFGFINIGTIPFSAIYGINPVSNMMGSYKYKVFKKTNRYGKGILVSCNYTKNDDPNAVAFANEVITPIHESLQHYDAPGDFSPAYIDAYTFFKVEGNIYTLKKNKAGSIIFGLILLAIGIHELTPAAWLGHDINVGRVCFLLFTIIGGAALILGGFTDTVFDKSARMVSRKSPIGLGNKTYYFDEFNGIQTVRKSTNFIYSGTDVQAYFLKPGAKSEQVLLLSNFFSTRKVERFITEVNSILL
ncbi:hypothetical protein [Pedobacter aquatilis]|uniref:hypothetical protein n=1 Tax=Pedobacter aquatilis TaxID=351343 RepID=UPI0029305786|nr:hypothetical protein [Pedobacter aquatilis]